MTDAEQARFQEIAESGEVRVLRDRDGGWLETGDADLDEADAACLRAVAAELRENEKIIESLGEDVDAACNECERLRAELAALRAERETWEKRAREMLEAGQSLSEGINHADEEIMALKLSLEAARREGEAARHLLSIVADAPLKLEICQQDRDYLRGQLEAARKALEPFAAFAATYPESPHYLDLEITAQRGKTILTIGQFRAARAALAERDGK